MNKITIHKDLTNNVLDNNWNNIITEYFFKWEQISRTDLTSFWKAVLWWLDAFYKQIKFNNI